LGTGFVPSHSNKNDADAAVVAVGASAMVLSKL